MNSKKGYSLTLAEQLETLESILPLLEASGASGLTKDHSQPRLASLQHLDFLLKPLQTSLPGTFVSLDASKPWILFWLVQSLSLLGHHAFSSAHLTQRCEFFFFFFLKFR
jgi:protein farnesyltransferase subunit beta